MIAYRIRYLASHCDPNVLYKPQLNVLPEFECILGHGGAISMCHENRTVFSALSAENSAADQNGFGGNECILIGAF